MTKKLVRVAVPTPLQRCFDYLLSNSQHPALRGRVSIPFGRRKLIGIVTEFPDDSTIAPEKLRAVDTVIDSQPLFSETLFDLLCWASRYYQHPLGEVMQQAMPALLRQGKPAQLETVNVWQLDADVNLDQLKRAPKQFDLATLLQQYPKGLTEQQLRDHGFTKSQWQALANKQFLSAITINPETNPEQRTTATGPILNAEQQTAVEQINASQNMFNCFLLEGVTGSGKTEVYLQVLAGVLAEGKQALVLVPEIALTPQTVERFKQRFNQPIGVLHSNLSDKTRLNNWVLAKNGGISLIIGTRSAIFSDFKNLGIIIIDEEHDLSLKQHDTFRYSARDLAIRRAQLENIPIVLGSATPSLESLHNAKQGRYRWLTLTERAGNAKPPTFQCVDLRKKKLTAGMAPSVIALMQQHLAQHNQVLVFLNRRGFATTLLCHDCGWIADCSRCEIPLTLHKETGQLHCHHCEYRSKIPNTCPKCGHENLLQLGIGTERLEHELQPLFPDTELIRIDRDSTRKRGSIEQKLEAIKNGKQQILIGTQMLAKGHHFPNVTLVVILNADQSLFSADFRATERFGQLLLQVAGRAGREQKPGTVVVQTHQIDNPLLYTLIENGYPEYASELLLERQAADLPPFSYLVLLRGESTNKKHVELFLREAKQFCQQQQTEVDILGPIAAIMAKRAGKYRMQLLLQSDQRKPLQQITALLRQHIETLKSAARIRWSLDVDPLDMF